MTVKRIVISGLTDLMVYLADVHWEMCIKILLSVSAYAVYLLSKHILEFVL